MASREGGDEGQTGGDKGPEGGRARRGEATMTTVRGKCGEGGGYKKEKCVRKTTTRAAAEGKSVAKGADRAKGKREREKERGEKADRRTANEGKANGKHSMKRN